MLVCHDLLARGCEGIVRKLTSLMRHGTMLIGRCAPPDAGYFDRHIMKQYNLQQFVEELLIPDLQKMIDRELHYYAFSVICQAIEVLGGIYDQKGMNENGESESRFNNAIDNLFRDKKYREKRKVFFSYLRGPLIHQLRVGEGLCIASQKKDGIRPENHLEKDNESGNLILVIEQFYRDFVEAFAKCKRELAKRKDLDHEKVNQPFIIVASIKAPHPTQSWNSETKALETVLTPITGCAIIGMSSEAPGSLG